MCWSISLEGEEEEGVSFKLVRVIKMLDISIMSLFRVDFLHCALLVLVVLLAVYVARGSFREDMKTSWLRTTLPPAKLRELGYYAGMRSTQPQYEPGVSSIYL